MIEGEKQDDAAGSPSRRSRLIVLAGPTAVGKGTVEAMTEVEQHALDVCGTPLSR